MRRLLLARHGDSEYSAKQLVNGDPGVSCPLTEAGREQARALGRILALEQIDLCAVTEFERVRETAEMALAGRDVPFVVVPELNDPRYGEFEGGSLDVRAGSPRVGTHEPGVPPRGCPRCQSATLGGSHGRVPRARIETRGCRTVPDGRFEGGLWSKGAQIGHPRCPVRQRLPLILAGNRL